MNYRYSTLIDDLVCCYNSVMLTIAAFVLSYIWKGWEKVHKGRGLIRAAVHVNPNQIAFVLEACSSNESVPQTLTRRMSWPSR